MALPKPQPARNPITWPTVSDKPARLANSTIMISPVTKVALTPMRVEMKPAKNIVKAVTSRYEEKSSNDSNAMDPSCSAIVGRIGDTSPKTINAAAEAKGMDHHL